MQWISLSQGSGTQKKRLWKSSKDLKLLSSSNGSGTIKILERFWNPQKLCKYLIPQNILNTLFISSNHNETLEFRKRFLELFKSSKYFTFFSSLKDFETLTFIKRSWNRLFWSSLALQKHLNGLVPQKVLELFSPSRGSGTIWVFKRREVI